MRDDKCGLIDKGGHLVRIDADAAYHLVGDAGKPADLRGDRKLGSCRDPNALLTATMIPSNV
jgi:hypothetical protein